jgi:RimJ/RimL family protein N-acetyltransferase
VLTDADRQGSLGSCWGQRWCRIVRLVIRGERLLLAATVMSGTLPVGHRDDRRSRTARTLRCRVPEENEYGQRVGDVVPGWEPRKAPALVSLAGRYVQVEPLSVEHAPALYATLCGVDDRELWTYRPTEPPDSVETMAALVRATVAGPSMLTFALVPDGGEAAGLASYMRIEPEHGQIEVAGVLYARTLRRTRAATEAIHLLMRHAFEDLGYRRFEWKCDSLNEPSRRAAVRLGFVYEGRFRNPHGHQGTQPGHRLVLGHRRRVAAGPGRAREVARPGELRRRRPSADVAQRSDSLNPGARGRRTRNTVRQRRSPM